MKCGCFGLNGSQIISGLSTTFSFAFYNHCAVVHVQVYADYMKES